MWIFFAHISHSSPTYRDTLAKSRKIAREAKLTEGSEAFMPDECSIADSSSTWNVVNVDSTETMDPTGELRVASSKLPLAISEWPFNGEPWLQDWSLTLVAAFESNGLTISCTVLYPEQFDALRRTYDCEKSMVESLSRCVKWNASGGKSGSAFLKTRGEQLVLLLLYVIYLYGKLQRRPIHRQRVIQTRVTNHGDICSCIF